MDPITRTLALGSRIKAAMADGWENIFTGLGIAGKDKRTGGKIKYGRYSQSQLESAHDADDIAHRVVNLLPDEGTLKWVEHKIPKKKGENSDATAIIKAITDEEDRLSVKDKFNLAWKWARLYGGSAIYVSVVDGLKPSEPLNLNRVQKIVSLTVLHRYEVQGGRLNDNLNDPNYGMPEFYTISGRAGASEYNVHHSRIIRLEGSELSQQQFLNNDYWHDSVLVKLYDILRDYNAAYSSAAHVVQDFNVNILKLKNLADIIGGDKDDLVTSRLKLMNLSKSIMGSILIDADNEDFKNLSTPLTGLDKTLEKLDQRLVMATGMPHTVVLGDGATGTLSGKGESEEKQWKGMVAKEQDKVLTKPLDKFYAIMFAQKQGPTKGAEPKDHTWSFCPLYQPSPKETAETRKAVAETDKIYVEIQALNPLDVAKSRFGGDEYSMETTVDMSEIEEMQETEKIHAEETRKLMFEDQNDKSKNPAQPK